MEKIRRVLSGVVSKFISKVFNAGWLSPFCATLIFTVRGKEKSFEASLLKFERRAGTWKGGYFEGIHLVPAGVTGIRKIVCPPSVLDLKVCGQTVSAIYHIDGCQRPIQGRIAIRGKPFLFLRLLLFRMHTGRCA